MNAKDIISYTPLTWAARHGHKDIVRLLIEKGADVDYAIARLEMFAESTQIGYNRLSAKIGIALLKRLDKEREAAK